MNLDFAQIFCRQIRLTSFVQIVDSVLNRRLLRLEVHLHKRFVQCKVEIFRFKVWIRKQNFGHALSAVASYTTPPVTVKDSKQIHIHLFVVPHEVRVLHASPPPLHAACSRRHRLLLVPALRVYLGGRHCRIRQVGQGRSHNVLVGDVRAST